METLTVSSLMVALACIAFVAGAIKVANWVWLRPKKLERWLRQQGIPGTSYKFLYGDVNDSSSTQSQAWKGTMTSFSNNYFPYLDPFHHRLITQHGDVYFTWSGPKPVLNISRPEFIREALTKTQEIRKPKQNPTADEVFPGLINYEGEKWARHRKIVNPAFHMQKLKLMMPAFFDSCVEMIEKWDEMLAETGTTELDVWPDFTKLTADVISRAAFGSSYEEGQRTFKLLQEQTALAFRMMRSVYIPGWRYVPTRMNRNFNRLGKQIDTLLTDIITKRKEKMAAGEAAKDDLLGILLDSNSKEIQEATASDKNCQLGMTLQEVISECKLFFLAGQETTSILLVWTMLLLGKHQDWQAQARKEVLETFGSNVPDFEGLNHLKTVTMILYEALRLYPPSLRHARRVYKDTKLGDLSLPAGALLNFQVCIVHQNKESWGEDAEEFRPDRFSEGISKASKGNISFFPFGWGPRICIGEKFAMIEAKMALSMILRRFSFELSSHYVHAPIGVVFLQPQHGAQIVLHKI